MKTDDAFVALIIFVMLLGLFSPWRKQVRSFPFGDYHPAFNGIAMAFILNFVLTIVALLFPEFFR